jgi:hypothetical protein
VVCFGLPRLGLGLDPHVAGVVALGLSGGACVAEILRSGFNAIPQGQFEAARSLGLRSGRVMFLIILPQLLRIVAPCLTSEAIDTLKNTSRLSAITIVEITLCARQQIASAFRPFDRYTLASMFYLVIAGTLNQFARWYGRRHPPRHACPPSPRTRTDGMTLDRRGFVRLSIAAAAAALPGARGAGAAGDPELLEPGVLSSATEGTSPPFS